MAKLQLDIAGGGRLSGSPPLARGHAIEARLAAEDPDPLYRNMHPMIAERLDLWRLSNFELQRLSSAEDVYLFHAVAKQNPKDERLIAIAEVRDLTPARDSAGRIIGFPHLEAMLAQAFADIRLALGRQSPEQRPRRSRVILYVRPAWEVDPEALRSIAHRLAPITIGLGLEKITVRIRSLDRATGESRDAVLDIGNVTEPTVTVRVRPISGAQAELRHELADTIRVVRAEMLKQVADEFDNVHDIRRALRVGSVDHIIPPGEPRPFIIGALKRRLATGADLPAPHE